LIFILSFFWTVSSNLVQNTPRVDKKHALPAGKCPICKVHVPGFDHHCSLLGTCVGQSNRAAFTVLLFSSALILWIVSLTHVSRATVALDRLELFLKCVFGSSWPSKECRGFDATLLVVESHVALFFFQTFCSGFALSAFALFHISIAIAGYTTRSFYRALLRPKGRFGSGRRRARGGWGEMARRCRGEGFS